MANGQSPPAVSVVMNVRDGESTLREALDSMLAQTYAGFECVIVDDGSRDGTRDILLEYAAKDARIVLLRNRESRGIYASANRGMRAARGRYVARMDADDIADPRRLAVQKEYLDRTPDAAMVCANWMWESAVHDRRIPSRLPASDILSAWFLLFYNHFACQSAVMFRRDDVLAIGGYNERLPVTADYELWARLSRTRRLGVVPECLVRFRRDLPGSVTVTRIAEQRHVAALVSTRAVALLTGDSVPMISTQDFWSFWPTYWKRPYPAPGRAAAFHACLVPVYRAFVDHWRLRYPHEHAEADRLVRASVAGAFRNWSDHLASADPASAQAVRAYAERWQPSVALIASS